MVSGGFSTPQEEHIQEVVFSLLELFKSLKAPSLQIKGNAVKIVADMFGIKQDEIMGCGDQNNDIELLTCSGIGVAMGNATDTLKGYADYITDTVDNDGVVKAINKFVYGEK